MVSLTAPHEMFPGKGTAFCCFLSGSGVHLPCVQGVSLCLGKTSQSRDFLAPPPLSLIVLICKVGAPI